MGQSERVTRIEETEAAFDRATAALGAFEVQLARFEAAQTDIEAVADYYGSKEWFEDREADEAGELPSNLKCGILGEDLPYALLVDYHDLAVRMLEAATRALR